MYKRDHIASLVAGAPCAPCVLVRMTQPATKDVFYEVRMARPRRETIEYFPHYVHWRRTLMVLDARYGNDGYAAWFRLLELLGDTPGHCFDARNPIDRAFLTRKLGLTEDNGGEIMDALSELGAIDSELWKHGLVWCENLVHEVESVYAKRRLPRPKRPDISSFRSGNSMSPGISDAESTQSRVEYSKKKRYMRVCGANAFLSRSEKFSGIVGRIPTKKPRRARQGSDPMFSEFWSVYPNRKSRSHAEKAWGKINPDRTLANTIITAVRNQIHERELLERHRKFVPPWKHPATWLNGQCWTDEIKSESDIRNSGGNTGPDYPDL